MLHSTCQKIWKSQQWPEDKMRTIIVPITKKGSTKECSSHWTVALISHACKLMLNSSRLGFSILSTQNFQMFMLGLAKAEEPEIKLPTFEEHRESKGIPGKHLLHWPHQTVWITTKWKIFKEMAIPDQPYLPLRNLYATQKATVRSRQGTINWFKNSEGVLQGWILSPWTEQSMSMQCEMLDWMSPKSWN